MKKCNEICKGYTRVTEILLPYKNFDNIPENVLKVAAQRGSIVHDYCELYALNMLIENPTEEVKPYFESFKNWFDEYVSQVLFVEKRVYSKKLLLSGKFDLLCRLKGSNDIVLVDYKTPVAHEISWRLQTAAYAYLLLEEMGIQVNRRICLRLSGEGKPPKINEYLEHERDKKLYLNQLEIFRLFNPFLS